MKFIVGENVWLKLYSGILINQFPKMKDKLYIYFNPFVLTLLGLVADLSVHASLMLTMIVGLLHECNLVILGGKKLP